MATYNLNEVLKAKEAQNAGKKDGGEVKLDDVSRVKVLSPGRQVFKRFIRNRLAVFGTCLLLIMFIFSFLGPLVYPYGQKQIFYTYEEQNVNYALAKVNTAYNGYTVDDSVTISRVVANVMNSNVKSMIEKGEKVRLYTDETGSYEIRELGPEIYSLATQEAQEICTVGISKFEVGTFNSISKELTFIGEEIPGLAAAAAKSCKGKKGDFTYNGIKYTFVQGKMKTYELTAEADGINYATDVELVKVTADACVAAMENGEIAAALLSDTFAYAMVKDGKLKCIRSQQDTDFADRTCCVLAMNGTFVKENPTIAKKVAQAVQKAHSWMRDNSAEATQVLMDMGWNGGNYEMNIMINNALQFGLSDEFTGATLKDFIERYVRLGLITSMDDTDEILNLAWTPIL